MIHRTHRARVLAVVIGAAVALSWSVGTAVAQSVVSEVCKRPNTTLIHVTMANGSVVQFLLERQGSAMTGMAIFDRGKGPVKGEFSGQYMYWDVAWEDGTQASFRGQLVRGEGGGTASHSSNKDVSINWTAHTPEGCARWPEPQAAAPAPDTKSDAPAQLFAPPQAATPPQTAAPPPARTSAPAKAPPVKAAPRTQQKAAAAPVSRAPRACPAGSVRTDNGDCVQPVERRPSLLAPLIPFGGILFGGAPAR
jgi:hypothetical protein